MVEQKAELKGRSERGGRKVAEEHKVVCGMQLAMVAGEKYGCGERLLEKTCRMMCDCMAELGVDRKWTNVAANKSKDDTKTAVKQRNTH